MKIENYTKEAVDLLKSLISIPSVSRNEDEAASLLFKYCDHKHLHPKRSGNNIWTENKYFDDQKPTILLNSHIDTVNPTDSWSANPFEPIIKKDKITGLGANDAGVSVVSLLSCFEHYYDRPDLPYNLILGLTAEEEISGSNGIASILNDLGPIQLGIIGEPTNMQLAIAEKGLIVIDGVAHGEQSHAAIESSNNAIYNCINDLKWFQTFQFTRESKSLGQVKMSVTQINSGTQHNIIPDKCSFVIDVRTNELYTNQEVFEMIKHSVKCQLKARSLRLSPSVISISNPLVQKGLKLGLTHYGSNTLSDQALLDFDTVKIGPGKPERSHQPDEFVRIDEIKYGISTYINLLEGLNINHYETLG